MTINEENYGKTEEEKNGEVRKVRGKMKKAIKKQENKVRKHGESYEDNEESYDIDLWNFEGKWGKKGKMRKAMRKWGKSEESYEAEQTVIRKCYISDNFPHFSITFLSALLPCCQCFHCTEKTSNQENWKIMFKCPSSVHMNY